MSETLQELAAQIELKRPDSAVATEIAFGELTVTVTGGQVSAAQGVLGGAVPKSQLLDAVAVLPDGSLPAPLTKETVTGLIQALVQNDIDSDGDGVMDAASIGIKLVARDANVVGAQ